MEKFSTKLPSKRGPKFKYKDAHYAEFETFTAQTKRGKQNNINARVAINVLTYIKQKHPELDFDYLLKPKTRWTILAELGRFDLRDAAQGSKFVLLADGICKKRVKSDPAIRLIRSNRLNRPPPLGEIDGAISRAIDNYRERYPRTSDKDVFDALKNLTDFYERQLPKPLPKRQPSPARPA